LIPSATGEHVEPGPYPYFSDDAIVNAPEALNFHATSVRYANICLPKPVESEVAVVAENAVAVLLDVQIENGFVRELAKGELIDITGCIDCACPTRWAFRRR
jgi:hypothetical protein